MWLTICIDLITKVKSLRRKLNLFKCTLCFAFFKKYRIYTSHFFTNLKIASQNAKCEVLIQTLSLCIISLCTNKVQKYVLVYFTTWVRDISDTSATQTTWVQQEWDMTNTSVAQVLHEQHECDKSATSMTKVQHKWRILILIMTWAKTFSNPYISYIANERLQGEEQFHSKNHFLETPFSHVKMCLKSAPQKLNFVMSKAISKSYMLDCSYKCPCLFLHKYA